MVTESPLKIFGGSQSMNGDWGWHVAIYLRNNYHCGGTLINSLWVVTNARCVDNIGASVLTLGLGLFDVNGFNSWSVFKKAEVIIKHEVYDAVTLENDIALIKLDVNYKLILIKNITLKPITKLNLI